MMLLTDEEIMNALIRYSVECCRSNPIKPFNQTEAIKECVQAQLKKVVEWIVDNSIITDRYLWDGESATDITLKVLDSDWKSLLKECE